MKEIDLKNLNTDELFELISPSSEAYKELRDRGILRTKNVVGEIGEYYAIKFYNETSKLPNLTLAPPGVQNVDALSRKGEIYSIKTVTSRSGTTGSFWDPESIRNNNKKFDYLIIIILNDKYHLDMVIELSWDDFMENKSYNKRMNNYNISLTQKLTNSSKVIFKKNTI